MKEKNKVSFIEELSSMLPKESVERAKSEAEKEIFNIRLSNLRKEMGIKQEEIESFSQSSISKIEKRKDMKISTLINYLDSIGLKMEIKVYRKNQPKSKVKEILLLKT